jgi:hypothetical protein
VAALRTSSEDSEVLLWRDGEGIGLGEEFDKKKGWEVRV